MFGKAWAARGPSQSALAAFTGAATGRRRGTRFQKGMTVAHARNCSAMTPWKMGKVDALVAQKVAPNLEKNSGL